MFQLNRQAVMFVVSEPCIGPFYYKPMLTVV